MIQCIVIIITPPHPEIKKWMDYIRFPLHCFLITSHFISIGLITNTTTPTPHTHPSYNSSSIPQPGSTTATATPYTFQGQELYMSHHEYGAARLRPRWGNGARTLRSVAGVDFLKTPNSPLAFVKQRSSFTPGGRRVPRDPTLRNVTERYEPA